MTIEPRNSNARAAYGVYCSGARQMARESPHYKSLELPPALSVGPEYGLTVSRKVAPGCCGFRDVRAFAAGAGEPEVVRLHSGRSAGHQVASLVPHPSSRACHRILRRHGGFARLHAVGLFAARLNIGIHVWATSHRQVEDWGTIRVGWELVPFRFCNNQERGHAYDQDFRNTRYDPGGDVRRHIGVCLSRRVRHMWGRLLPQPMSVVDQT